MYICVCLCVCVCGERERERDTWHTIKMALPTSGELMSHLINSIIAADFSY